MKRTVLGCIALLLVMGVWTGAKAAQHPTGGRMPMCGQAGQQEQPGGQAPMMEKGMMGQGMRMPMGCAMCPMMRGMMEPAEMGMMGMMGAGQDAKAMGRMLQMRGEVLKAIGEVLLKHGTSMVEHAK
ncbi:MAG: hypothetical protein HYY12_06350 [Candidatus Methylomirabilis oxyfera]|nr:hypothetical protein [Candidatus Methylomirabilis oxyfera]